MLTPAKFDEMVEESQLRNVIQRIESDAARLCLAAKELDDVAHAPLPRRSCQDGIKEMRETAKAILEGLDKAEQQLNA